MAEQLTVTAQRREVLGKRVRRLRRQGIIPAHIFGRGRPSEAIQLDPQELRRLFSLHAGSKVIQLRVDGKEEPAIVRFIQHEPRSGKVQHIDFLHVELTERLRSRIPVRLTGEAPAVRTLGGTLLHMATALEIECMARDLPEALELDVSGLEELDAILHAREVPLPTGATLMSDPEEPVVKVAPPRMVEEAAPAPAAAEEAPAPAVEAPEEGA